MEGVEDCTVEGVKVGEVEVVIEGPKLCWMEGLVVVISVPSDGGSFLGSLVGLSVDESPSLSDKIVGWFVTSSLVACSFVGLGVGAGVGCLVGFAVVGFGVGAGVG